MAARVLDRAGEPVGASLRERLLGSDAHDLLAPYLDYTRAGHRDLLDLAGEDGNPPPCLESIRKAEAACGERLLREVIATLGWSRLNLGIGAVARVAVSVGGSFPLFLTPAEARLLDGFKPARRLDSMILFTAHGGAVSAAGEQSPEGEADPVGRFRSYNIAHAEVLGEILSVAPLSADRVERIVEIMDRVADDFVLLFARHDEECAALPRTYAELKAKDPE